MAGETALPLQQFIASLDDTCLPKILQVCSGVYFQGSVYEISGSEVSFSTGDLIKVIGLELLSVCLEDLSNNEKFELPINHTGLFKVVPDEMPFSTVEEMMSMRPVGLETCLPFTFTSRSKMTLDNVTLGAGRALTVLSIEQREGEEDLVRCHVQGQQEVSAEVLIPLSTRGDFIECESKECFTLKEIMSSPGLRSRKFRFENTNKCQRPLVLSPIHQVNAIMNLRKNILKFPSSLEVDVVDVTELCQDVKFVTPLSLPEVLSQPDESFPAVVNVLEGPDTRSLFKCSWLPELSKRSQLVVHKKGTSAMILLSSLKSRKAQQYFLVSHQYGGRFRRRPREFNSVYELYVASMQAPGLKVSVMRNCEEVEEEGLPGLSVGDQLEVVRCERMELPCESPTAQKQSVEALLCHHLPEPDDGDDDDDDEEEVKQDEERQEVLLPLYMQGHFCEVLKDKKKYKLRDLGKDFSLPLDVKVVSRDTEVETDPLAAFACLRIEAAMLEPIVQVSFPHRPDQCFEVPTRWLSMSVAFTTDPLPWPSGEPPECHVDRVTEVTDTFFYEFRKQESSDAAPPPRPPKRNLSSSVSCKKSSSKASKKASKQRPDKSAPTKKLSDLTLNSKKRPPAPPPPAILDDEPPPIVPRKHSGADKTLGKALPNTYVKMEEPKKKAPSCEVEVDSDSDHDYETVDETLLSMVKAAQENVMFY
ncbi:protein THEMIS2 [Sparus aurata]|uniref:protein THEMIS2 n=1 Tax=Sparus aurata TaxID=8175 RepID=UPI0011C11221|nr:protein THEMIS2 [Sparus aurata]